MSIAALSSSFVAAVRERPTAATPAVTATESAAAPRGEGRRAALIDAIQQVAGGELPDGPRGEQAVFRFAQALMHDLRRIDGGGVEGPGRGHAWGRRDWSDLPQRLDALATASGAPAAETPATPPPEASASPSEPPPLPEAGAAPTEPPPQPNPVTTTSAALHLMQVPTSRLLEAFAALREALGQSSPADSSDGGRAALAEFLTRLSGSLAADTTAALPAGSVVDLRA